jgi:hypothetical protein
VERRQRKKGRGKRGRKGGKWKGKTENREKLLGRDKGMLIGKRKGEESRLLMGKRV